MIEEKLKAETDKWLKRIEEKRKILQLLDDSRKDLIVNMDAYTSDCKHFTKEGKLIEAFEAVIWAWSILELGERVGWWR
ncbi:MAG: DUF357 domain-containing protein [Candidatus Aenigmatarchaeota archaeon]